MNEINLCPLAGSYSCPFKDAPPVFGFDGCAFHNRDKVIYLTGEQELAILETLFRAFKREVRHDALISAVWGMQPDQPDNPKAVIKVVISNMRKRLRMVGLSIRSVYDVGYVLEYSK